MMKSMQFSWSEVAWICCTQPSPRRWCIRLYCSAPLPCRQWWIWFISMVASSAHSHSAGWQWQTDAGSPQICLLPGQHSSAGEKRGVDVAAGSPRRHLTPAFLIWGFATDLKFFIYYLIFSLLRVYSNSHFVEPFEKPRRFLKNTASWQMHDCL